MYYMIFAWSWLKLCCANVFDQYSGGIFSRIEAQWKQANAPAPANKGVQSLQRL